MHVARPETLLSAIRVSRKLHRFIKQREVTIIHAHMMSCAVIGRLAIAGTGSKLVTTVHNSFDTHSFLMRLGQRVVAVSAAERDLLIKRGFPTRKLRVVLNGTRGSTRLNISDGKSETVTRPSVVTLSGLHPRKAVSDVLRAWSLIANKGEWVLHVGGDGPQLAELVQLANALGITESVRFLGSVRRADELLAVADVFVAVPLADPCPLAVIEARVAGCAIVGSTVGGIPEILEGGHAGILVAASQPAILAEELMRLMSDPLKLRRLQDASAAGVEYFSLDRVAGEYKSIYRELHSDKRGRWG